MCNCCSYEFWNLGFHSHILVKALVSMSTKGELKVSYTMARKWAGQALPLAGGHWIIARELTAVCLQRQNQHLIWAENQLLPLWSHSGLLFISVNRPLLKTHYWLSHSLPKAGCSFWGLRVWMTLHKFSWTVFTQFSEKLFDVLCKWEQSGNTG